MPHPAQPARWCPRCQVSHPSSCPLSLRFSRKQTDEQRGTVAERGYGWKWQKARIGWLSRHPLCAECERHDALAWAAVVDHIVPHRGDMAVFWDPANWQSLCKPCHDSKTASGR